MLLKMTEYDHIVRLVDTYEDSEYLHLVTDLYTGGELFDKIIEKKKASEASYFAEDEASRISCSRAWTSMRCTWP